jgi:hypothetical protein
MVLIVDSGMSPLLGIIQNQTALLVTILNTDFAASLVVVLHPRSEWAPVVPIHQQPKMNRPA